MNPTAAEGQIVLLNEARARLAKVASVDEAKSIRDKAEAIRHYAKQAKLGLETQNKAAEIKIRAERRTGELLAKVERKQTTGLKKGKAPSRHADATETYSKTIKSAGISEPQSRRFQAVASIPEPMFEAHVELSKATGSELTSAATVAYARALKDKPPAEMRDPDKVPSVVARYLQVRDRGPRIPVVAPDGRRVTPMRSAFLAPGYLTASEAAAYLRVSLRGLDRKVSAGLIGCSQERQGIPRYFRRDELDRYRDRYFRAPVEVLALHRRAR
jgi:hypothetical protein